MTDPQLPTEETASISEKPSVLFAVMHVAAILVFWKGLKWGSDWGLGLLIGIISAFGFLIFLTSTLVFSLIAFIRWMKRNKTQEQYFPGLLAWALAFCFCCAFSLYALFLEGG